MAGKVYQYDSRGRLVEVAGAQFTVNMLGERVAKTYQGTTTLFHYDQWGRLIAETDANGAVKREYLYLGNLPVALVDLGSDIRYIHTDHLGTPRLVSDALKHPVWAWQGEPFGATPANEDPEDSGAAYTFNLRFPGQYFDKETGHHYNYFRDYDPQNGRYVQSDPIGLAGGINTYTYVEGNPLSYIDPFGLAGTSGGVSAQGSVPRAVRSHNEWVAGDRQMRQEFGRVLGDPDAGIPITPNTSGNGQCRMTCPSDNSASGTCTKGAATSYGTSFPTVNPVTGENCWMVCSGGAEARAPDAYSPNGTGGDHSGQRNASNGDWRRIFDLLRKRF